ncbi:MAG: hypothetical protein IT262_12035 [Saprospiraceae bacterium]|nr:hypothetical protein [Saprospiraceae bacterium]
MLTENDVISILSTYLTNQGYLIVKALNTGERGIDLIAENFEHCLYIEAKGETSSKDHTARYGAPFNGNQIKSHVSRALLAAMLVLDEADGDPKVIAGIALPDNPGHRSLANRILRPVKSLGIRIFWVSQTGVEVQD